MPGNFKKDDLRIIKTRKYLLSAFAKLLKRRSFKRLTVNDICEEAQVSRATFYSHFKDKYDLLEFWLRDLKFIPGLKSNNYIKTARTTEYLLSDNKAMLKNLLDDADNEVYDLFIDLIISLLEVPGENYVLTNFCAGGLFNLLFWIKDSSHPPDLQSIYTQLNEILSTLLKWETDKIHI